MKHTLLILLILRGLSTIGQINSVFFDSDKYTLTNKAREELNQFYIDHLQENTPFVVIKGYTDTVGSIEYNTELSMNRVEQVQNYLIDKGYNKNKIKLEHWGEDTLSATTLEFNRRVDLFINPDIPVYSYINETKKEVQKYLINTEHDTTIIGRENTLIFIPQLCFSSNSISTIKGIVEVSLLEYYSISDIMLSELTTQTDKEGVLETGGMIYVDVKYKGEKCNIKPKKSIIVGFPEVENVSGMNLYQGDSTNNGIIWKNQNLKQSLNPGRITPSGWHKSSRASWTALYVSNYLDSKINYPLDALTERACGCEQISYNVNSSGVVSNVKIVESIHPSVDKAILEAISSIPPAPLPPYKKEKKAMKYKYYSELCFRSEYCKKSNYRIRRAKEIEITEKNFSQYSADRIGRLMFESNNIGWLNCDRLATFPGDKVTIHIKEKPSYAIDFKIKFDEMESIAIPNKTAHKFHFKNLPDKKTGTLIGIKYNAGRIYLHKQEIVFSKKTIKEFEFKEVTFEQLKTTLDNL